jgi:predicted amidohydrolase YtcJ
VRGFPVHQALSAAVPRVPVVLERADAHAVLVNGAAMAARGLTRDAAAPPGGEILRDGRGEPTGLLVDAAQALVAPPPRTPAERRRALSLAQEACLAAGVTSLHDAGSPAEALALFREAAAAGALTVRLHAMVEGLSGMRAQGRSEPAADGGFLAVRAAKLFADGALGSRGAALLEPYADDPATAGLLLASPEEVLEAARHALAHGFQLCTHAIGDRANRLVLDAWERARSERPGARDPRPRLEHAQVLHPDDLPRLARLGVIASVQPCHAPSDRPWAGARLGPARLRGAYAWRSLLAAGARLAAGTDAPIEPLSPVANLHAAVTRQDAAGQPPGGFDPGERLTREEALRAMTLDAAFAAFAEGWRGSVTPGKVADLVVLSRDPMAVTDDELRRLRVDATVVGGRILFERPGA